jgi:hypothetical protein
VPNTAEERTEAEKFVAAATCRTWRTYEELRAQPRQSGPFVIRWISQPRTGGYLTTTDEAILFGDDGNVEIFDTDPRVAVTFSHADAIELIPRLMKEFKWEETADTYFDTIRLSEAVRAYLLTEGED